jgi:hypothetical protein
MMYGVRAVPSQLQRLAAVGVAALALSLPNQVQAQIKSSGARTAALTAADVGTINNALRVSLGTATAREAFKTAIRQQLRTKRPIAFVNGYWVTPIDLAAVYAAPDVRAGISTALAGNVLAGRLNDLVQSNLGGRIGLAFTPNNLAPEVIGPAIGSIRHALAGDILSMKATDMAAAGGAALGIGGTVVISVAVGIATSLVASAIYGWWTAPQGPMDPNTGLPIDDENADPDNDNVPNRLDGDDDGDGTPDDKDSAPYDPKSSICDCGRPVVFGFTNNNSTQILQNLATAFTSMPRAQGVSLGTFGTAGGQSIGGQVAFFTQ